MGLGDYLRPIVSAAAAYAGWQFAGPVGGAIGWGLGMGIGGALFPPEAEKTMAQSMGPAQALTPTSTVGAVVPVLKGTRRIAGNLIWYTEPIEAGAAPLNLFADLIITPVDNTEYAARVSFAYGICHGPSTILRFWNDKEEYVCFGGQAWKINEGDNVPVEYMNLSAYEILLLIWETGDLAALNYMEYNGYQTVADPSIVASKGAESTPPYKNLHYVVFNNFPIKTLTSPIPSLTFECCNVDIVDELDATLTEYGDDTYTPFSTFYLMGSVYTIYTTATGYLRKIERVRPSTLEILASVNLTNDDGIFNTLFGYFPAWSYYADEAVLIIKTSTTILQFDPTTLTKVSRMHLGEVVYDADTDRYFYCVADGYMDHYNQKPPTGDMWPFYWVEISDKLTSSSVYTWQYGNWAWGYSPVEYGMVYRDLYRNASYQLFAPGEIVEHTSVGRETPTSYHSVSITGYPTYSWYHAPYYYVVFSHSSISTVVALHRDSYFVERLYSATDVYFKSTSFSADGTRLIIVGNTIGGDGWLATLDRVTLAVLYGPFTFADLEFTACAVYEGYAASPSSSNDHVFIGVDDGVDHGVLYAISYSTGEIAETFTLTNPGNKQIASLTSSGSRALGYLFGNLENDISEYSQFKMSLVPQQYVIEDVTPQNVSADVLTNEFYGEGLDPSLLETTLTGAAENYAIDNDLLVSTVFDQQQSVLNALQYVAQHHNGFFSTEDGLIAHRQLEIDDEEVEWETNLLLSDAFSDAEIGSQWIAHGETTTNIYGLDAVDSIATSESVLLTGISAADVTEYIPNTDDDGHGYWGGVNGFSSATFAVTCGYNGTAEFRPYFRFTTVGIPQGATIISATLHLCCAGTGGDSTTFHVHLNNTDDADRPTSYTDVQNAVLTDSHASYATGDYAADNWYEFDCTDAVQEVINRGSWSDGNDIMVLLEYADSTTGYIQFYTYDTGSGYRAYIHIEYNY